MFHKDNPYLIVASDPPPSEERELPPQIVHDRRKRGLRNYLKRYATDHQLLLLSEFLKRLLGSLLAFWIIAKLLAYIPGAAPAYTLAPFGLLFSILATYYQYRLSTEPNYKVPRCGCSAPGDDKTEIVFRSGKTALLGVPNSLLGAALYSALLLMVFMKHHQAAMCLAATSVLASAYLSYLMVVKIEALCGLCINIAALNLLILCQFLR